jgi:hypothetical protein
MLDNELGKTLSRTLEKKELRHFESRETRFVTKVFSSGWLGDIIEH